MNNVLTLLTVFICAMSSQSYAQNSAYHSPFNSNLLIQEGIDPQILNLAITTYRQNVAFTIDSHHTVEHQHHKTELDYKILYDPFTSYGIDLRLQVPNQYVPLLAGQDIYDLLDQSMGLQIHLQSERLYNPNSFKIESKTDQLTIISFTFSDSLPRELAFMKSFKGFVHITAQGLDKIVVTNQQRYKDGDIEVAEFKKVLTFIKVPNNGGYLLDTIKVSTTGIKENTAYVEHIDGRASSYKDNKANSIVIRENEPEEPEAELIDYKTYYVELDRIFPLFGQDARKKGYDLPKAFGISMITMLQETTMHMTSFELNGNDVSKYVGGDEAKVVNKSAILMVRADMWLLPFLNVGLIVGKTQTKSDITLQVLPDGIPDFPSLPPGDYITINDAESSSVVYGGGATIAGGAGDFFGTVDMQYVTAYTEKADAELTMSIITPIVGYHFKNIGYRALIGAQYQDTQEKIVAGFGDNDVVVGLHSEKWAGLIGIEKGFDRHWNGSLMYSYGDDRSNLNLVIGYRF